MDTHTHTHTHTLECEHRKCNPSPLPLCSPHTWTRPVPTLRQSDTDGANMRDVSGVARERYLLARWKPNAVNYTACLPNHSSPREMAGQDKLVISRKTIHLERWCAVCSQEPPSCSLESDNGREMEQLTGAERWRAHVCRSTEGCTVCVMVTAAPSSHPTPVRLFISLSHMGLIMSCFTVTPLLACCCHCLTYLLNWSTDFAHLAPHLVIH